MRSGGTRSGGVRSGSSRSGGVRSGSSRRGSADALAARAGVRSGSSRYANGSSRAGVRYGSGSSRTGVRYGSGRRPGYGGGYGPGYGGGYHYGYGGYGYYHNWAGSRYYGYYGRGAYGGGWGVYWDPFWYGAYSPFWASTLPVFGFGVVYYAGGAPCCGSGGGGYDYGYGYSDEPVVIEQNIIVQEGQRVLVDENGDLRVVEEEPAIGPAVEEGPMLEEPLEPAAPGVENFKAGIEAFKIGDFETALDAFRLAAEVDETNGEAWMAVMHAAFAEGEYAEAAEALSIAADLGAFPRGYRFDPRPAYPNPKVFEGALELLRRDVEENPNELDGHLLLAYFHVAEGERSEASASIMKVLDLKPNDQTAPILSIALLPPLPPEKEAVGTAAPEQGGAKIVQPSPPPTLDAGK